MAIDTLARGMAANASGGGGGGVDVGITPGVGIRFDGTDPVEIINTGVTAVTTPGSSGADADAPLGSVKVSNPGAENSADRVHYVVPKGLDNAAFKDVDTEINSSVATSTKLPTTKAVYDELVKKVEATLDTSTGDLTTTDDAHVATSKLIKAKLDDKLDTTTTINGVSVSNGSYTLDGDDIDLTGYTPISSGAEEDVAATDSVNDAVAKVEYKADNRIPTDNIDTDFPVSPDATHVLASTVASATFQGTGTAGVNPKKGLVPAPSTTSGTETRYLKADGTWDTPPNSEYSEGTGIDISNAGVITNTGVTHIENSDPADDNVGNGTFKVVENGTAKWIAIKGLDDAAYKDVDADTISDTTSTAKLPTDKAVAAYVSTNYIPLTQKGATSGVAELDASGKVLASQLPSFVDDVIDGFLYSDTFYTETPQQPINEVVPGYYYNDAFYEDSAHTELITGVEGKLYLDITSSAIAGYRYNETDTEYVSTTITGISTPETGKIYTDISTNKSYRWGGSAWSLVASDLALGETATTAYRGDRGKIAYDHSQTAHAPSNAEANVLEAVKINGTAQTIVNKAIDITADTTPTDGSNNLITSDAVYDALTDKVDKEAGKGLSTNDLTDNLKNSYDGAVTHAGTTSGNPHNVSKSDVGLGNVTNNAQVKAVSGTVTSGGIVTFGADGATVADSGKTISDALSATPGNTVVPTEKAVTDGVTQKAKIAGFTRDTTSNYQVLANTDTIDDAFEKVQRNTDINQNTILSIQGTDASHRAWEKFRNLVRAGIAPEVYPVGTTIYDDTADTTGEGTAFEIVAYNHHFDPKLTALGYANSVTLLEKYSSNSYQYDAPEAFLYVTTQVPAGKISFTIPNWDTTYGGNKTYVATLTQAVPVGGQITLLWNYNQNPTSISTYAKIGDITAIETVTIAVGDQQTVHLGTINLDATHNDGDYGKLNHIYRVRYGSNNYFQSGLRQYMNTKQPANVDWWSPTTIFDRPVSTRNTVGKLGSLNQGFVDTLANPDIVYRTCNWEYGAFNGADFTANTEYHLYDKLFLLSHTEVGFADTPALGTNLGYYTDNNSRIKKTSANGSAIYWWLRTPHPTYCHAERGVSSDGSLYYYGAHYSYGCPVACVIQ